MYDSATPYIASYVVLKRDNKVAFVLRSNTKWMNGYYGLPSGKVERGESFSQAAIREAREEVGVEITADQLRQAVVMQRKEEGSTAAHDWIDVLFVAAGWQGEPYNAEPEVHGELAWLDLDDLPENIVPSVRHVLKMLEQGVTYTERGW